MARIAAIVALAGAAIVLIAVVSSSLGGEDGGREADRQRKPQAAADGCRPEATDAVERGYYVVEQGDLLSLIAERTCVPDDELARLNPKIDPQTLTPGQCISLVEGGCENRE